MKTLSPSRSAGKFPSRPADSGPLASITRSSGCSRARYVWSQQPAFTRNTCCRRAPSLPSDACVWRIVCRTSPTSGIAAAVADVDERPPLPQHRSRAAAAAARSARHDSCVRPGARRSRSTARTTAAAARRTAAPAATAHGDCRRVYRHARSSRPPPQVHQHEQARRQRGEAPPLHGVGDVALRSVAGTRAAPVAPIAIGRVGREQQLA